MEEFLQKSLEVLSQEFMKHFPQESLDEFLQKSLEKTPTEILGEPPANPLALSAEISGRIRSSYRNHWTKFSQEFLELFPQEFLLKSLEEFLQEFLEQLTQVSLEESS